MHVKGWLRRAEKLLVCRSRAGAVATNFDPIVDRSDSKRDSLSALVDEIATSAPLGMFVFWWLGWGWFPGLDSMD